MTPTTRVLSSTVLLTIILLTAALLRFNHFRQPLIDAFGWRETSTAMMAKNFYEVKMNILYPQVDWGGPGPNYQGREFQTLTFIVAILYKIFGMHDFFGRIVVILFSLWGLFSFYQMISLVWDRERAAVCAAILAIMPGAIFMERSFIPDPVMVSLLLNALWLLALYGQTGKQKYFVGAILIGGLGVLTKLNGLIIVLPAVYLITTFPKKDFLGPKKRWLHLGLSFLMLAIVAVYYLWANHLAQTGSTKHFAGAGKFLNSYENLKEWLAARYYIKPFAKHLVNWMWSWPVLMLVAAGIFIPIPKNFRAKWLFHFWGIALVFQYLIEAKHLVSDPYNMHMYMPFAAAISGHGLYSIAAWLNIKTPVFKQMTIVVVLLTIVMVGRTKLNYMYYPYYFSNYTLGLELKKVANKTDMVTAIGLNPGTIYHSQLRGWVFPYSKEWNRFDVKDLVNDDAGLLKMCVQHEPDWLVITAKNDHFGSMDRLSMNQKYPLLSDHIFSHYNIAVENNEGLILKRILNGNVALVTDDLPK